MLNAVVRACHVQGCLRPQATRVSITCASINSSFITAPEQIPFLLAHTAPHAVHLTCPQRERQAFWPDLAPCADFLCLRYLLQGRAGRHETGKTDRDRRPGMRQRTASAFAQLPCPCLLHVP